MLQSFILSRRTYVNKIMFGGCLFSFIYILQEYTEIIRKYLANMDSRSQNLFLHPSEHELIFWKFQSTYFWVSNFFAKQYTLRYLCEETYIKNVASKYHVFWEIKKINFWQIIRILG
jgi:hypothetical protein